MREFQKFIDLASQAKLAIITKTNEHRISSIQIVIGTQVHATIVPSRKPES